MTSTNRNRTLRSRETSRNNVPSSARSITRTIGNPRMGVASIALSLGVLLAASPAFGLTVSVDGEELRIDGGDSSDAIEIWEYPDQYGVLSDLLPGGVVYVPRAGIARIKVELGSGFNVLTAQYVTLPIVYIGGDGIDHVWTGYGDDTIFTGDNDDIIHSGPGDDHVEAGDGWDRIDGGDGDDVIYGFRASQTAAANDVCAQDVDTIMGGDGDDWLYGGPCGDTIEGGNSNDHIWGFAEDVDDSYLVQSTCMDDSDFLYGDFAEGDATAEDDDTIFGGPGNDWIEGGVGNDTLFGQARGDDIYGGDGEDTIYGGDGRDVIWSNKGADVVYGGNNADEIHGGNGDDFLDGEDGRDTIYGGFGSDVLIGGLFDSVGDELYGEWGKDFLYGGGGSDKLYGGANDDLLVSIDGDTDDELWGGDGFDSFWANVFELPLDGTTQELSVNFHGMDSFDNAADLTWDGDEIADPPLRGGLRYFDYGDKPLFGQNGPVMSDVDQNGLGSCWLLAALAAMANTSQNSIYQSVIPLPDKTFIVEYDGRHYRIDADLPYELTLSLTPADYESLISMSVPLDWDAAPTGTGGTAPMDEPTPCYAGLGSDGSLWVALIEKAVATGRFDDGGIHLFGQYDTAGWSDATVGLPFDALSKMGGIGRGVFEALWDAISSTTPGGLADMVEDELNSGNAVECCTTLVTFPSELTTFHCYTVVRVFVSATGDRWIELRNPWHVDDEGLEWGDPEDGHILVTPEQFWATCFAPGLLVASYDFSHFNP